MHKGTSFTEHVTLHACTLLFDNSTACHCLRCQYAYHTYTHAYWCLSMCTPSVTHTENRGIVTWLVRQMHRKIFFSLEQNFIKSRQNQFINKIHQQY